MEATAHASAFAALAARPDNEPAIEVSDMILWSYILHREPVWPRPRDVVAHMLMSPRIS